MVDDDFKSSKPVAKAPQEGSCRAKHHNEKLMLQQLLQD
jgi:hypothetical protein